MSDDATNDGLRAEGYTYYAFISYSHRDVKWAELIQRKLEGYKLPNVRGRDGKQRLPSRVRPIFRDQTDLSVGPLMDNLHRQLESSKYLIVVCSPNSAQANAEGRTFVDEEVRYFCEIGRSDNIIPVIIGGTPSSAFCPTLRGLDLLALDATKFPKPRIVNDIVARILDLRPDELWRRERRRRLRRIVSGAIGLLAFLSFSAFGGWYWWDWGLEKTVYFADYEDRLGVPQGLRRLERAQLAGRQQAYRFHYRGYDAFSLWKRKPVLRKAFCVNSFDRIRNETRSDSSHAQTPGRTFAYGEDHALREVAFLNAAGEVMEIRRYAGKDAGAFDVVRRGEDGRMATAVTKISAAQENQRESPGHCRVIRNAEGFAVAVESYRDARRIPIQDASGIFRMEVGRDGRGRVVSETYRSPEGRKVVLTGVGDELRISYDSWGNRARVEHLKAGEVHWTEEMTYDAHDNCTRIRRCYVADPSRQARNWSEKRLEYDANGELSDVRLYDRTENPWKSKASRLKRKSTFADGRLVETDESYFDAEGNPGETPGVVGCPRIVRKYDKGLRVIETQWYGRDGRLLCDGTRAAVIRTRYDSLGRELEQAAFGADGRPWTDPESGLAAKCTRFVDEEGELVKTISYFDASGGAVQHKKVGGAREETRYDRNGRLTWIRILDEQGEPMSGKYHWHKTVFKHDRLGYLSEISCWGVNGEPVLDDGSWSADPGKRHAIRFVRDEAGRELERSYHGLKDELVVNDAGWAIVRKTFDAAGKVVETAFFGEDGNPVVPKEADACRQTIAYGRDGKRVSARKYAPSGICEEVSFDENGKMVKSAMFGADGRPAADENGIHKVLYRYDALGRQVKEGFFDVRGRPTLSEERVAGFSTRYDEFGAVCEKSRFGVDGGLVKDINGVSIVRWHFDDKRRDTGRTFYDTHTNVVRNTKGVAGVRKSYDERGNLTEEFNVDCAGKPIPDKFGVCIAHCDFDDRGRMVRKTFLDGDRRPVLSTEGIGGYSSKYDGQGHETERLFFGTDGKPTAIVTGGGCGWRREYDERGNVMRHLVIDGDGRPMLDSSGLSGWEAKYDVRNRVVEKRSFGADGAIAPFRIDLKGIGLDEMLCEAISTTYDEQGRKTDEARFAQPCGDVWRQVLKYDLDGNVVELSLRDASGRLVTNRFGFARVVSKFNEYHEVVERTRWGMDDEAVESDGVHKLSYTYRRSQKGLSTVFCCYNRDGMPVNGSDGVFCAKAEYDREYRMTRFEKFDANNHPVCGTGNKWTKGAAAYDSKGRVTMMTAVDAAGNGFAKGIVTIRIRYPEMATAEKIPVDFCDADGKVAMTKEASSDEVRKLTADLECWRYVPEK